MEEPTTNPVIPKKKPRIVEFMLLISVGLNIFLFGIFVAAAEMSISDRDFLAGKEQVVDTIYVHYVLHARGEAQYTMLAENSRGRVFLSLIPIPLKIHAKYKVVIDRTGITVKERIRGPDEEPIRKVPKLAPRNSAQNMRGVCLWFDIIPPL